ncbi:ANTAR domain-containing protein [Actinomadura pelletieri DSM 43383]|uniref:ANTAR domain-containing protein n=1 Tax=Actinomadura pelletieri DSM 43383 TaxID=1120940 RepID=A0A495QJB6_9ACTN|nr:ANTAR domain-containing protein [Actinomadura pelletieri]RKS72231.1 ANTAR domain-containing protein [Actinomadura pelletieri DSM 43383]
MTPTETVLTDQLALEIARLGMVGESSDIGTLHRVTELASRAVPGCAGAASVRWALPDATRNDPESALGLPPDPSREVPRVPAQTPAPEVFPPDVPAPEETRPEPLAAAASHPDLAEVTDRQLSRGHGPIFDVVLDRRTLSSDDILGETRWPEAMSDMLRRGVRCFTTAPHLNPPVLVTLTLYGVTPKSLGDGRHALASLLIAQGTAAVSNTQQYDDVHRTAIQLQEAVEARAIVDQAKGILMHALGCDADEAFAELRRISQTRHVKLTALAQRIVGHQGLP